METEDRNNLKDYLPSDISNTSYEAKITNVSNEIVTEAQKTDASYSYNVSKNGNIGNQAEIEFTIHSNNYEDITFKVYITLTDRITVTPKEGTEPVIEGSNELYYGQTISELKLNTKKAKFVTPDGTEVSGILKFNTPDEMPEVGTKTVEYTFTPDEEQYKSSIVIPDYVTVKRVKCKVVSINKKAVIKVPKKQYNKYKKLFTSKTGFKKPMKLKK